MQVNIRSMTLIEGVYTRAVAEIDYAGLRLRGLKLELHEGRWELSLPGRRMKTGWQVVYEIVSPMLQDRLRAVLVEEYSRRRAA
jgi:hypothetical protein